MEPDPDPGPEISAAVELVRPLTAAGVPTYAVLGNHDYSIDWKDDPKREQLAAELRAALQAIDVPVLGNEAVALPPPSGRDAAGAAAASPGENQPPF